MAYLETGTEGPVELGLGGSSARAEIVSLPFYKKPEASSQ